MTQEKRSLCLFIIAYSLFVIMGCKKKDATPLSVPTLTTLAVTNINSTTATSGGDISSNGGSDIVASGICWSKTSTTPTITDDTTKGTVSNGTFSATLKNLSSSSTYYVRAYATNSIGTGYGNVITFMTGNAAPIANAVMVTGQTEVNKILTATYAYSDAEGDAQGASSFQWYVANDAAGTGEIPIAGANALTYTVQAAEQAKYIRFGVTPKAISGTTLGAEVKSAFIGAIGEATTVTFTYNGTSVTYGIITSPVTNRKWLDRNLGAPNTPTGVSDFANYGDLFQWGRLADGHQLVTRNGPNNADMVSPNGSIGPGAATLSASDNPGHNKFILNNITPADWRNPQNNNLWQGVNGINNPCPNGWRIPTAAEWAAENLTTLALAYTQLKLTFTGYRFTSDGSFLQSTTQGHYWSSTIVAGPPSFSLRVSLTTTATTQVQDSRGNGRACRCIKD